MEFVLAVLVVCGLVPVTWTAACNATKCLLPDCFCPSTDVPNGLQPEDVPQMVVINFDGRLTGGIEKLIHRLFHKDRTNPNKCPIVGTFYVSNENTDYCSVNRLWAEGHEIGVTGTTRHTEDFWRVSTANVWNEEVTGQVENLVDKAGISHFALEGFRTPHLVAGADNQFNTLDILGFNYDSTLSVPEIIRSDNKTESYWPFTLDHPYTETFPECSYKCPQERHKGLWELPILPLRDGKVPCKYLNACPSLRDSPVDTYQLLHNNFQRHFQTNRSPFTVNIIARWLIQNEEAAQGLENFIVDMVKEDEVWVISGAQAIQWARRPRTLAQLDSFTPWGCFARRYKRGCEPRKSGNRTLELFPGLLGESGNALLLYQYISLTILFLVIFQYDRNRK